MIRQIVYISASRDRASPSDAAAILDASHRNNPAEGLTGVLAFADGSYFQILEGEPDAVAHRFSIIRRDPRHSFVIPLLDRESTERRFGQWSMAWLDCPPDHPLVKEARVLRERAALIGAEPDSLLDPLIASIFRAIP